MKLLDINFNDIELYECAEAFEKLNPVDRLSMSPYELAEYSEVDSIEAWKKFLKFPAVTDYIKEEVKLFTASQQLKLITTATEETRSTGHSAMISALGKVLDESESTKDSGQMFIYCYTPLNAKEEQAPNVRKELFDVFNTDSR